MDLETFKKLNKVESSTTINWATSTNIFKSENSSINYFKNSSWKNMAMSNNGYQNSSLWVTANNELDRISKAEHLGWSRTVKPLWSSYLLAIKNLEAKYKMSSARFYQLYKANALTDTKISKADIREWIRLYRLYYL